MKQHLFIIEGIDGAGKTTQVASLCDRFSANDLPYRRIKLPNYDYGACEPVKLYLAGEFGTKPDDVNAFAASSFFALKSKTGIIIPLYLFNGKSV